MADNTFPTPQDIRTHNSVAAKLKKHRGIYSPARLSIKTPEALCEAMLIDARRLYRSGESVLHVEVKLLMDNFLEWAQQDQAAPITQEVDRGIMLTRLNRAVAAELKSRLAEGTFLVNNGVRTPASGVAAFWAKLNVINPKPII